MMLSLKNSFHFLRGSTGNFLISLFLLRFYWLQFPFDSLICGLSAFGSWVVSLVAFPRRFLRVGYGALLLVAVAILVEFSSFIVWGSLFAVSFCSWRACFALFFFFFLAGGFSFLSQWEFISLILLYLFINSLKIVNSFHSGSKEIKGFSISASPFDKLLCFGSSQGFFMFFFLVFC